MNRDVIHEAGHAVVALHFGFHIEQVEVKDGLMRTVISDFDGPGRTATEKYLVLAGGISNETRTIGNFDRGAMGSDQEQIRVRGGGQIEGYSPEAQKILEANRPRLDLIVEKLSLRSIMARLEAQFSPDPDSYELLSGPALEEIWSEGR
jgi:hypothetical protein